MMEWAWSVTGVECEGPAAVKLKERNCPVTGSVVSSLVIQEPMLNDS